jgi:CheY-like chemotaxis protein
MKPVLLVEDSPDDIFIMERAWQKVEFVSPLIVVNDGQQAIDYISGNGKFADRKSHPAPCLVLLDIKLPFLSGLQVVKWLREYEPSSTLPAVFLTSSNADMDIHEAYKLGGNAYLVKPPTPEKLVSMLHDLRNFWLVDNRMPPDCLAIAKDG